jgi:murein L,D-transpeptidase YafK
MPLFCSSGIGIRSLFACAALALLPAAARAHAEDGPTDQKVDQKKVAMTQAGLPNGSHREFVTLIVDKATLTAELKTWPDDPAKATTLRRFRIAVGKAEGDKQVEGDNRTPEGIYFAQMHIDGGLPEKYGRAAIPIDFPNPIDQIAGKTGHGIWLHGVDHDGRVDEAHTTEGCVVFYNADIAQLANWLKGYQGAVVIAKDASQVNNEHDVAEVKKRTLDWMNAWAARSFDDYMTFYAPNFRFERMSLKRYFTHKKHVFGTYKQMKVSFDNLRVITHPKYAVAFFNQDFHGDKTFSAIGRKVLYWQKNEQGQWMIEREVYENRRFEFVTYTDAELALLSDSGAGISSTEKEKKAPNL